MTAEEPKTFDEGVQKYAEAIRRAYQDEGDVAKAREAVAELRRYLLSLPTTSGINKHFRLDQIEAKVCPKQPAKPQGTLEPDTVW